jgi:hypothetical protein
VGLTESKIRDLHDKKFDTLYESKPEAWLTLVRHAYEFAQKRISGGNPPRPDDILKALLPMLEVNEDLRKHQEDNRARYKRFREYFGDFIIDKQLSRKPTAKEEK